MSRVGVIISGRGTNLQALIDAERQHRLGGKIVVVISNKSKAEGLQRARAAGIPTEVVTRVHFPNREQFDRHLVDLLNQYHVDLVVLAGFMRVLGPNFISSFAGRIINVHPSLLPAFKGVNAQQQAVEYGVKISGCTTHFVNLETDGGPIILQRAVDVMPGDTGDTLAARILVEEHKILVDSVRLFCEGRLRTSGGRTVISE
jgi:phosphoribosylglycinamide formyltransferase-1